MDLCFIHFHSTDETLLCFSGTMFSASDQTPTCRADQKSQSKVVSNKTLVGGLEAGKFSFVGVVRYSSFGAQILFTLQSACG